MTAAHDHQDPRRITVFTGSAPGGSPVFAERTAQLARALAERGIGVVYGGGKVGLIGVLADAALAAGGAVHGVMPRSLVDDEIAHDGLTGLDVVADMHERKLRMCELAEAFVALPGGAGTLEELFEVWTWQQLGIHAKPVALFDVDGYWRPLLTALEGMSAHWFLSPQFLASLVVADTAEDLLAKLSAWTPPRAKWS